MIVSEWKMPGYFKANPQLVAEEIRQIGDEVTPKQVLEAGRNPDSELHKCFEWDDTKAAEKWRLEQAGQVLRFLVIREVEEKPDNVPVRTFYKNDNGGYKPSEIIFTKPDEYQKLLQTAWAELRSFKAKYARLQELSEILALID